MWPSISVSLLQDPNFWQKVYWGLSPIAIIVAAIVAASLPGRTDRRAARNVKAYFSSLLSSISSLIFVTKTHMVNGLKDGEPSEKYKGDFKSFFAAKRYIVELKDKRYQFTLLSSDRALSALDLFIDQYDILEDLINTFKTTEIVSGAEDFVKQFELIQEMIDGVQTFFKQKRVKNHQYLKFIRMLHIKIEPLKK